MSGVLITITGPSGVGKTTLERKLTEELGMRALVSTTTREPRDGEIMGHDYHFISREEFEADPGRFIEQVEYGGNLYGLTKLELLGAKMADSVVVVDPDGREQVHKFCEANGIGCVAVFLNVTTETLVERHLERYAVEVDALERCPGQNPGFAYARLRESTAKRIIQSLWENEHWGPPESDVCSIYVPQYTNMVSMMNLIDLIKQAIEAKKA